MKKYEMKLGYTTIQHLPRTKYGLSNNDYCIADAIYHLSNNPNSIVFGWCFATRETLGSFFDLSKRTVINSINKLKEKELIEIDDQTKYLRTTQKWYNEFIIYQETMQKSIRGEKIAHPMQRTRIG